MSVQIKLRRDTAANWTNVNPILSAGEPGLETDTNKIKYGDGVTAWSSLPYPTVTFPTSIAASNLANNIAGGSTNQLLYQTQAGTTGFITAPTQIGFLQWTGSGYSWSTGGYASASQISGTTLASNVVNSSITTLGNGVTATTFNGAITANGGIIGALTGNASTATKLASPVTINGTSFDGSINVTVTAAASSLTGNTLNPSITTSSLTSVGTLTSLTVSGTVTVNGSLTVGGTNIKALSIAMAAALS